MYRERYRNPDEPIILYDYSNRPIAPGALLHYREDEAYGIVSRISRDSSANRNAYHIFAYWANTRKLAREKAKEAGNDFVDDFVVAHEDGRLFENRFEVVEEAPPPPVQDITMQASEIQEVQDAINGHYCYFCYCHDEKAPAVVMAPQQSDGKFVPENWRWYPICESHKEDWWDGSGLPVSEQPLFRPMPTQDITMSAETDHERCPYCDAKNESHTTETQYDNDTDVTTFWYTCKSCGCEYHVEERVTTSREVYTDEEGSDEMLEESQKKDVTMSAGNYKFQVGERVRIVSKENCSERFRGNWPTVSGWYPEKSYRVKERGPDAAAVSGRTYRIGPKDDDWLDEKWLESAEDVCDVTMHAKEPVDPDKERALELIADNSSTSGKTKYGEEIVIFDGWYDVGKIVMEYNNLDDSDETKARLTELGVKDTEKFLKEVVEDGDIRIGTNGLPPKFSDNSTPYLSILPNIDDIVRMAYNEDAMWGFDNEYIGCGQCTMIIKSQPSSGGYDYMVINSEVWCVECLKGDPSVYIDAIKNKITDFGTDIDAVDITKHRWVRVDKIENATSDSEKAKMRDVLKQFQANDIDVIFKSGEYSYYRNVFVLDFEESKARALLGLPPKPSDVKDVTMQSPQDRYEIWVGNIGLVHSGNDKKEALKVFNEYVEDSKKGYGRAAGEPVTITEDGDDLNYYGGTNVDDDDEDDDDDEAKPSDVKDVTMSTPRVAMHTQNPLDYIIKTPVSERAKVPGFTKDVMPYLICKDGVRISIQASSGHHCHPKDDIGPWTAVELKLGPWQKQPKPPKSIMRHAEEPKDWKYTVYNYVPIAALRKWLDSHGGPKGFEDYELPKDEDVTMSSNKKHARMHLNDHAIMLAANLGAIIAGSLIAAYIWRKMEERRLQQYYGVS